MSDITNWLTNLHIGVIELGYVGQKALRSHGCR